MNDFNTKAKWISNGMHYDIEQKESGSPALYLRKSFDLTKLSKKAFCHICGLGLYELKINGKKVSDAVLKPSFTDYNKTIIYNTYDVAPYLKKGKNIIDVILGDGWANQTGKDEWDFYKASWRNDPKLLFSLTVNDVLVVSDDSWSWSYGEIIKNCLRCGEVHDFNSRSSYHPVTICEAPKGRLTNFNMPPMRECEILKPISCKSTKTHFIYDFGKNMSGYVKAKICAPKGTTIKITYSDRLVNDLCDNTSNSQYMYSENLEYQVDTIIASGKKDLFVPLFVYHGFRYVTITNNCEVIDVKACFVHTDLKRGGAFDSSCELANRYYDMTIQAILSNYVDFPTDCPHREKNGWTGDAQLSAEACIYNFDMKLAYRKWLNDIADTQLENGKICCIAPTSGWGYQWGWGPAWDVAFFVISDALLYYYDDKKYVEKYYPRLKKYFEFILTQFDGDLCPVGLGDWNYPKNHKFDVCPTEFTSSAYVYLMAKTLTKFSMIFNDKGCTSFYRQKAKDLKKSIINKYKDEKSLTGLATLTYFGFKNKTNEVIKYLENHNFAPDMGILGTKFVFDVLGKAHRPDIAMKILSRNEYPTFKSWMDNGQTTLCEDFELTNSLNHHMFSPVSHFFIRYIAGIEIKKNGYIDVKPCLPEGFDYINCSVMTKKGIFKIKIKSVGNDMNSYRYTANYIKC